MELWVMNNMNHLPDCTLIKNASKKYFGDRKSRSKVTIKKVVSSKKSLFFLEFQKKGHLESKLMPKMSFFCHLKFYSNIFLQKNHF
jgi:hypothetical protein